MVRDTRAFRSAAGFTVLWLLLISPPCARAGLRFADATRPRKHAGRFRASFGRRGQRAQRHDSGIARGGLAFPPGNARSPRGVARGARKTLTGELERGRGRESRARRFRGAGRNARTAIASRCGAETPTEARLNRLEEDQQLLQAKVDEQHQTKVESASKYRVKLSGIALLNLFGNSGTVDNQDVPNLALPPGAVATSGSVGATVAAIRDRFGSLRSHPGGSSNQRECEL